MDLGGEFPAFWVKAPLTPRRIPQVDDNQDPVRLVVPPDVLAVPARDLAFGVWGLGFDLWCLPVASQHLGRDERPGCDVYTFESIYPYGVLRFVGVWSIEAWK